MVERTMMSTIQMAVKDPAQWASLGPITISSESGRFLTAPYALLAARVLDVRPYDYPAPPDWTEHGSRGIAEVWQSLFPSHGYAFSDIDSIPEGASHEAERGT